MPLFFMCTLLFVLEGIKIKNKLHKGIPTFTTEMVVGAVAGLPEQYYATTSEKKVKSMFPYTVVNNTLQARQCCPGMPGAGLQTHGALQIFCLA